MYSLLMAGNISSLSNTYAEMLKAAAASDRIFTILDREPSIPPNFSHKTHASIDFISNHNNESISTNQTHVQPLSVEFHNVNFSYPSRKNVPILSGLTLKINPGENVAICGSSGSGKSTIASLLTRLYEPSSFHTNNPDPDPDPSSSSSSSSFIYVGDKDIRSIHPKTLRESIGIVSQEPLLFAESIADNIRYGRRSASNDEVKEAARLAHVLDFTDTLPDGLETQVGQRGMLLSGGQKQRIAIARTILKDPPIVILDEATSALDAESERLVQNAIGLVMKGRTVLSIAHRLSTIKEADRILVLKDGQIVEDGTFNDLLQKEDGAFVELMGSQITMK